MRIEQPTGVTIRLPDDWHVHLRDGAMLRAVLPYTARLFRYALVMPNLEVPVTSTAAAVAYRERILEAAGPDKSPEFEPLMSLYLTPSVTPQDLEAGFHDRIVHAVKYYPAGATTLSDHGGSRLIDFAEILRVMAEIGMPLLVHAESTRPEVDIFDREQAFLEDELHELCEEMPSLRVTLEHVSTAIGVDFVRSHRNVTATITPHHLTCDRSDMLAGGLRADLYCKPVINTSRDRAALVAAATSGDPDFYLGTDSAPHPVGDKYRRLGKPGIFSSPTALSVVADVFDQAGRLDQLESFVSVNGAAAHGLAPATHHLQLTRIGHAGGQDNDHITTSEGDRVDVFGPAGGRRWAVGVQPDEGGHA